MSYRDDLLALDMPEDLVEEEISELDAYIAEWAKRLEEAQNGGEEPTEKAWTDEAREAALETRRRNAALQANAKQTAEAAGFRFDGIQESWRGGAKFFVVTDPKTRNTRIVPFDKFDAENLKAIMEELRSHVVASKAWTDEAREASIAARRAKAQGKKWAQTLTGDEKKAVQNYVQDETLSYTVRDAMSGMELDDIETGSPDPKFLKVVMRTIDGLKSSLERSSLPDGMKVFRGIATADEKFLSSLKPGASFTDKSFMSTSLNKGVAREFAEGAAGGYEAAGEDRTRVVLELKTEGAKGASVQDAAEEEGREQEFLLQHGGKVKISSVKRGRGWISVKGTVSHG